MWLVDDAGVIRYANPPALTYLGVTDQDPEAMIGRCFREVTDVAISTNRRENRRNWPEPLPGDTNRFLIRPESSLQTGLWLSVQTVSSGAGRPRRSLAGEHRRRQC
ncbi:MAG: PAS domain-containing protein [Caldilineaceae bacterium]